MTSNNEPMRAGYKVRKVRSIRGNAKPKGGNK